MSNRRLPGRVILLALAVLLAAACAPVQSVTRGLTERSSDSGLSAPAVAPAAPGAAVGAASESVRRAAPAAAPAPQPANQISPVETGERLIVKTGTLTLQVEDVAGSAVSVRDLANTLNGFVVTSSQREEGGRPTASVVIRVPAERFDEAMDRLKELAVRVGGEQVASKDVTEEFVDTDARLRNLRATEARYLDLLQQARTVEDVLRVEQQLSNIRGQIEQLQGRLQYLERSAQTSTITVELRPYALAQSQPGDWNPLPVVRNALAALLNTAQFLLAALIWATIFTPVWLPLVLVLRRWRRRRAARRGAASAPPVGPAPAAPPSPAST